MLLSVELITNVHGMISALTRLESLSWKNYMQNVVM